MNSSIIKQLNLNENDIEAIESISTDEREDYLIVLKPKFHSCPICGSLTKKIHDYKIREINHKLYVRYDSRIYYKRRRYECTCCGRKFIEDNPFGDSRKSLTPLSVVNILDDLKPYNSTFSSVARKYNVSVTTVIDIFDKHVQIERKHLSEIICMDEFYFNRHAKYKYAFIIMDFERKVILDILESRLANQLTSYFSKIDEIELNRVRYVCIDMYQTYKELSSFYFKNAVVCIDPFHAIKKINDCLNAVRKRIMKKHSKNKKSFEYRLLKYRYDYLLKNRDELEIETQRKDNIFGYKLTERAIVDRILLIDEELKIAYYLKEKYLRFNDVSEETFTGRDQKNKELDLLIKEMSDSGIKEMIESAGTLSHWRQEILNSFVWFKGRRISNGPIEGKNNYIKKIISNANGLNNFKRSRNKFMYSQNQYEKFSLSENRTPVKRPGVKRGHYKKKHS